MPRSTEHEAATLEIRRVLDASAERVFEAWTTPELLRKWWGLDDRHRTTVAEMDLRVGGAYRLGMEGPDGKPHIVGGIFREVTPPSRLVYTWTWETEEDRTESLVTVEFRDLGEKTELLLRHELIPTAELRHAHAQGWNACIGQLEAAL